MTDAQLYTTIAAGVTSSYLAEKLETRAAEAEAINEPTITSALLREAGKRLTGGTYLPLASLHRQDVTKGELAKQLYPEDEWSVDMALPQPWLDAMLKRMPQEVIDHIFGASHVAFHFVTVYHKGSHPLSGRVVPITRPGVEAMAWLAG